MIAGELEASPHLPSTVRTTGNSPRVANVCVGLLSELDPPSPKSHRHEVSPSPPEASVNFTSSGAHPSSTLALNADFAGSITRTNSRRAVLLTPQSPSTRSDTAYFPGFLKTWTGFFSPLLDESPKSHTQRSSPSPFDLSVNCTWRGGHPSRTEELKSGSATAWARMRPSFVMVPPPQSPATVRVTVYSPAFS